MLTVKTPEEVLALLQSSFIPAAVPEEVPLSEAPGRVLFAPLTASEYVPGFDRSAVDGYAVRAADTFGCSDAIPAVLLQKGEVLMGKDAAVEIGPGECAAVPTGGAVPKGADAMVMVEFTEDYGDGTVGILKSTAPGSGLIFRGDDVFPGKEVLPAGRRLNIQDIGALAAMGVSEVRVCRRPVVGILSTGDELVPVTETPSGELRLILPERREDTRDPAERPAFYAADDDLFSPGKISVGAGKEFPGICTGLFSRECMRCEESSREYMRYEETWAVETARIENYLLKREGAETAGGGIYRCKSCTVKLMPLPPRPLGPVEIPRTLVEISGEPEEAAALHRRFFLQFISAGG